GLSQLVVSRVASRTRPYVQDCADDHRSTSHECGDTRDQRSLYAGHASAAFTSAGLTCLHHEHLPLYGGGAPDTWACIWSIAAASITAMGRVVADEHWTSDTLIGIGTGVFFGYYLPKWLHYDHRLTSRPAESQSRPTLVQAWGPRLTPVDDGAVVGVSALF